MKKLLIVAKNPETYFIKRLKMELGTHKIILYNPWRPSSIDGAVCALFRTTGVYHSSLDLEFAQKLNLPMLNSLLSLNIFRSKRSQYEFFDHNKHPTLSWCLLENWRLEDWPQEQIFLVKPNFGQQGWGIQVLEAGKLISWRNDQIIKGDMDWIVQPYLKATEFRVFFMGSERITLKRFPTNSKTAANFAQEGQAELATLPDPLSRAVERLIYESTAYYGAIDLFETPNGPVFLELNVTPGIEQLEKITNENLIKKLLNAQFFCHLN